MSFRESLTELPPLRPAARDLPADLRPGVDATPVPAPQLIAWSPAAAALLDLAGPPSEALLPVFAGNGTWPGAEPLATAYGGHQFGVWAGRLGDGRALLLGEHRNPRGEFWEVQLKGAGPTPYSRHADGRAVLRSSLREFLCSEAMAGLGIPTTRALALVASPLPVRRESMESAAVVTRLAPSFLRFGHFEWLAHLDRHDDLRALADAVIDRHFPALSAGPDRHARWLTEVVERTARLMAQWQCVGFCHGVMNTDNFSILGLTLDYGPFGVLDAFDAGHVCNHSDEAGRYAYDRQPGVGQWNCAQLLNACLPLLGEQNQAAVERATGILDRYGPAYARAAVDGWRAKLGLREARDEDPALINRFLTLLHRSRADFTLSFRRLAEVRAGDSSPDPGRDQIADPLGYDAWISDYRARLLGEASDDAERAARMQAVNPLYVLRNHLAQTAIERAEAGDFGYSQRLLTVLGRPFEAQAGAEDLAAEPPAELRQIAVSCSS
ncbi:YdiU family protein [Stagnimonas aquatica]|uniref:Protein nucleotidyltransferase YdiU n=1 Tax=Stagnimonas aquatica TaxID=2689987 RepID=A0A3N0VA80_9GAMM|nr:YdiU family protein [Stagnimonas aquatica]ROH89676.1 YdiU family protein [Stagnimonas aquatica]